MNKVAEHRGTMKRCFRAFICLLTILAVTACAQQAAGNWSDGTDLRVLDVSPADYFGTEGQSLEEACRNWVLSPQQVEHFFLLSDTYDERPYSRFYQVDCGISGHLHAEGRRWSFSINGGGTATLQADSVTRHFGCSAVDCAPFLLLPGDGMEPD